MGLPDLMRSLSGRMRMVRYPLDKHASELSYWKRRCKSEGGTLGNAHYRKRMLAMAGEPHDGFLAGKIVADFGCGPRGSLAWAQSASERIGIDVLADEYAKHFDLSSHGMRYVRCSEESVPLPDESVDVLYTLNAMDHVDNFELMCGELLRVLKPGGDFIGSFNLDEPPSACEPQMLTEEMVRTALLDRLEVISYRTAPRSESGDPYTHFYDGTQQPGDGQRFLWVRARKAQAESCG